MATNTNNNVINFRCSSKVAELLDEAAAKDNRSRSNLTDTLLLRVLDRKLVSYPWNISCLGYTRMTRESKWRIGAITAVGTSWGVLDARDNPGRGR